MSMILVGIGGACGSLCRFALGHYVSMKWQHRMPLGTFIINMTGALALGILVGLDLPQTATLLLVDGFLGAYTTFSTFMYEGVGLFKGHMPASGGLYLLGSLVTGIILFTIGFFIGGFL